MLERVAVCILEKPSALRRVVEGSEVFGRNLGCGQKRNPLAACKALFHAGFKAVGATPTATLCALLRAIRERAVTLRLGLFAWQHFPD